MFQNIRIACLVLLFCLLLDRPFAQAQLHPRGLITAAELVDIRSRISRPPYANFLKQLTGQALDFGTSPLSEASPYQLADQTIASATLYLLTEEVHWAEKAFRYSLTMTKDSLFREPYSFGLTRAAIVRALAIGYDFCYAGWNHRQRKRINKALFRGFSDLHLTMGHAANYSMASNWMGVRYGAVLLGASVYDNPDVQKQNPALAYIWDADKRLYDHLEAVFYANGWHGESMGYFGYDWSFSGLGTLALQNLYPGRPFQLTTWVPKMENSFWGISTAAVDIASFNGRRGLKPDLSDDHMGAMGLGSLALAMRLVPKAQQPLIKAVFHYRNTHQPSGHALDLMLRLLFYDETLPNASPTEAGWLTYHDPEQGIVILRNHYQDSMDVVFTLSATSRRVKGHQGPDTHTWRLMGLGIPWVIGGGRTGSTQVQTNFFPDSLSTPLKSTGETGILEAFSATDSGGWIKSSGSCLGLMDHKRRTVVSYSPKLGCAAAILMEEYAKNGKRWRIQVPSFLDFHLTHDGYILTAPNGASMRVRILSYNSNEFVRTGLHRYGGNTIRHNKGVVWGGKQYEQSRWIDIQCQGRLTVLMTLQKGDKTHPKGEIGIDGHVKVGEKLLKLP